MTNKVKKDDDYTIKSIVVVIIVLIVFFGIGYFIGVSIAPKQEEVVVDEEIEYNEDDPMIIELIDNLVAGYPCSYLEYYTNNIIINISDIPNELIYRVGEKQFFLNNKKSMSLKDFNSELQKYFSIGYEFNPENINYNGSVCYKYRYDSVSSQFVKKDIPCSEECSPNGTKYKITRVEGKNLELKVYMRVLFGSEAESIGFYSDYDRKNYITDDYDNIDKYYYKGSEYVFIFQKVDNNYLFVSSKKV